MNDFLNQTPRLPRKIPDWYLNRPKVAINRDGSWTCPFSNKLYAEQHSLRLNIESAKVLAYITTARCDVCGVCWEVDRCLL